MTDDRRSGCPPAPTAAGPNGAGGSASMQSFSNGAHNAGQIFAAIDLGTNNCRMLVARPNHAEGGRVEPLRPEFRVIDSFSRITRLGEGVSGSGRLSEDAMDRTIDALKCCADKMERRRVSASRQVATEACRRAVNCSEFIDRVTRETGLSLEIISAHEEATLALKGCAGLLDFNIPYAVIFDIGGGSTEVLFVKIEDARNLAVQGCISLPMGVVTVAEDCGGGDFCGRTYQAVSERVQKLLEPFEAAHGIRDEITAGVVQMIGASGTVTTLGGLHLGLERYDRAAVDGLTLEFEALHATSQALCGKTLQQRAAEPCIGWQRADLMLAGCAILEAICRMWPVGRLKIADRGLREGLLMDLIHPANLKVEPGRMHAVPACPPLSPL
jgi:exopolyphosphatase / guanosine-5'-triphosphate,3'-diphosphate pyrophosphatase